MKPCKFTTSDGRELNYDQARQYVFDNIGEFSARSQRLLGSGFVPPGGSGSAGGMGGGSGPSGPAQSSPEAEGGRRKVRAVIERVARKMEELGISPDQIAKVREAGTYSVLSVDDLHASALALAEEYGIDEAIDIIRGDVDSGFNYQVLKALLFIKLGQLKDKANSEGGLDVAGAIEIANVEMQIAEASTSEGQSINYNKKGYSDNPELFFYEEIKKATENYANSVEGNNNKKNKANNAAKKAKKIRKDALSVVSAVLSGKINAEQLFNPDSPYYLSDSKLRNSLRVLLNFGEVLPEDRKGTIAEMVRSFKGFDYDSTMAGMEVAKQKIATGLREMIGDITDEASIQEMADALTTMYQMMVFNFQVQSAKHPKQFVPKVAKDAFSSIAAALSGIIPPESIFTEGHRNYVSDRKMLDIVKNAIARGFGERLAASIKRISESINSSTEVDGVRDLIINELNDYNRTVSVPLDQSEIEAMADSLFWMFKERYYQYVISRPTPSGFKSKKDILNQLANVVAGKVDAITLFEISAADRRAGKSGTDVFNNRMRNLFYRAQDVAARFGYESWAELVKRLNVEGVFGMLDNQKEVSDAIRATIAQWNRSSVSGLSQAQTPLTNDQIDEVADAIVDMYNEIAEEKMRSMLESLAPRARVMGTKERIDKTTKAMLYGILDEKPGSPLYRKFAVLYGGVDPSQFPDDVKRKLRYYAGKFAKAKGAYQRNTQQKAFRVVLNQAIANQSLWTKIPFILARQADWVGAMIYNSLLFSIGTFSRMFRGNLERAIENFGGMALMGDLDSASKSMSVYGSRTIQSIRITKPDGTVQIIDVKLNQVVDGVYSALRGFPKQSEARSSGISDTELAIMMLEKRWMRMLVRPFTIPASRIMAAADVFSMDATSIATRRQVYMEFIKNNLGFPASRATIQQMVDEILMPTDDHYRNAFAQAYNDVIAGELYKSSGLAPDQFPFSDPRKSAPISIEAKIYAEWLNRVYEITMEQEFMRAQQSAALNGWTTPALGLQSFVSQVDDYAAKVTNAMTYMGTPRGTIGQVCTWMSDKSAKAPFLKYIGVMPFFINATGHAINNIIRILPVINAVHFAKYKAMGTRGLFAKRAEYNFDEIIAIDQNKHLPTLIATNLGAVAIYAGLQSLRGTPEEEKKKLIAGHYTGFTPMTLPSWMRNIKNEKGEQYYQPGKFYVNGQERYDYRDGAFNAFFGAIAWMDLWSNNYITDDWQSQTVMSDDKRSLTEAGIAYAQFAFRLIGEQSMVREQSKMVADMTDALMTEGSAESTKTDRFVGALSKKLASSAQALIPYSRLQKEIIGMMRDSDQEAIAKNPKTFWERMAYQTALEDFAMSSDRVDFFGRPVKAEYFAVDPTGFSGNVKSDKGEPDPWTTLFFKQNYVPQLREANRVAIHITKDDLDGEDDLTGYYNDLKYSVENRTDEEKDERDMEVKAMNYTSAGPEKVLTTIELTKDESVKYNAARADFVGQIMAASGNLQAFEKMDEEVFRDAMNRLYGIGSTYAAIKSVPDLIKSDIEDYQNMLKSSIRKWQTDFGHLGVEIPEKLAGE